MNAEIQLYGLSEQDILEGCIAGRRDMQELLYKYFAPKMFGICLRYANDYHDWLENGPIYDPTQMVAKGSRITPR